MDKKLPRIRKAVQALWGIIHNGNIAGFFTGTIYSGPLKKFCVPGMNCYSCPGALGACPIGSIQAMLSARKIKFPSYVFGFIALMGVLLGRFVCGWLCLFGLIQELLYKIPGKKIRLPAKADRVLRRMKYVFLAVFVILLPIILRDEMGLSAPYFCKYICPVGMLEGGIPLVLANKALRSAAHFLYVWKFLIMALTVLSSVFIYRPFCKYVCPLGAFYSLFNKISFLRLKINKNKCIGCGRCASVCRMQADPLKDPDSPECIRCGDCVSSCPAGAIAFTFKDKEKIILAPSALADEASTERER